MIHPTAIIHPRARIAEGVRIGPYAVIDEHVQIGPECTLGPHVYITAHTLLGPRNQVHAGAVIGDLPQDLRFKGGPTGVRIGAGNVIREHVTIHRANHPDEPTTIGDRCLLMASSHVGHNTRLGNDIILANGALLAGHVTVDDRAFISGTCLIHQFVRIGRLSLMQGGAGASKDLPPFTIARGNNQICGLNSIGLRRAGLTPEERLELRKLYHLLFRTNQKFATALAQAAREAKSPPAKHLIEFLKSGKRGFCTDPGTPPGAEE